MLGIVATRLHRDRGLRRRDRHREHRSSTIIAGRTRSIALLRLDRRRAPVRSARSVADGGARSSALIGAVIGVVVGIARRARRSSAIGVGAGPRCPRPTYALPRSGGRAARGRRRRSRPGWRRGSARAACSRVRPIQAIGDSHEQAREAARHGTARATSSRLVLVRASASGCWRSASSWGLAEPVRRADRLRRRDPLVHRHHPRRPPRDAAGAAARRADARHARPPRGSRPRTPCATPSGARARPSGS